MNPVTPHAYMVLVHQAHLTQTAAASRKFAPRQQCNLKSNPTHIHAARLTVHCTDLFNTYIPQDDTYKKKIQQKYQGV